jgi:hypothetical protein
MIYSNVRELVEHRQYVFDTLWNKSIPSEEKTKAIDFDRVGQIVRMLSVNQKPQPFSIRMTGI